MGTTALFAEFIIIGSTLFTLLFFLSPVAINDFFSIVQKDFLKSPAALVPALSITYVMGLLLNGLAESSFSFLRRFIQKGIAQSHSLRDQWPSGLHFNAMRYQIYQHATDNSIGRILYHKSLLRILQNLSFMLLLFCVLSAFTSKQIFLYSLIALFGSLLAMTRRIYWLSDATIRVYLSLVIEPEDNDEL